MSSRYWGGRCGESSGRSLFVSHFILSQTMQTTTRLFFLFAIFTTAPLLLAGCATSGQTRADYEYQKVQEVDASADQIYTEAQAWMAERFVSSQDAIQLRDEENHRLVANAEKNMDVGTMGTSLPVEMDLIVEARDGRFRMTARNFIIRSSAAGQTTEVPPTEGNLGDIEAELDAIRTELAAYVEESQEEDDW